jgi:hypothetical protein
MSHSSTTAPKKDVNIHVRRTVRLSPGAIETPHPMQPDKERKIEPPPARTPQTHPYYVAATPPPHTSHHRLHNQIRELIAL